MFHLRYDHQTEKILCFRSLSPSAARAGRLRLSKSFHEAVVYALDRKSLAFTGSNQAYRTISTGQLNTLLCLHLRPIAVVVFHGPQGYLVLRGASRLDAFSGYPVRS